jgi:ADP-ribosyl-[dinitrogen reductase] hydrolase
MCLALGEALVATGGWELRAVADAFVAWMQRGPVDIGNTCRRGLHRYLRHGTLQAEFSEDNAGNGAAMRNLPLALATLADDDAFAERTLAQARITHHHPLSDAGTLALGRMTRVLLRGGTRADCRALADELVRRHPEFRFTPWPGNASGYIVDTVQTVCEAFFATDNFEDCLVRAVNRGGDADTIGALAGQLAGACYGVRAIPSRWLKRLDPAVRAAIQHQTAGLLALAA